MAIGNGHWEWPLGIKFLQWVFQPHSGRNYCLFSVITHPLSGTFIILGYYGIYLDN